MATKTNKRPQKKELPQIAGPRIPTDPPLLDLPKAALTKLTRSAKQRSYVTRGQINSGLPSEDQDSEIADSLSISSEIGVNVVEVLPKAETKEPIERAGDPVRMYLRESRSIADQAKTIRVPMHMVESIYRIMRTTRQLFNEMGRKPTPEELAKKLGTSLDNVQKTLKIAKEPLSLDTPIGDEENAQLGDFVEDKNVILPIDAAIQSNLRETTTRALTSLTPREERVLRMRFGIGMNTDNTLDKVGWQFSVTRERIRQIEAKALRKLKHPSRARALRTFLEN